MMATTHALVGAALAVAAATVAPEFATVALLAGVGGGVFPDLDLYAGHRKTLHFPVYYPMLAVPAVVVAGAVPSAATVGVAVFLAAAAAHSAMDALGGGLELKPWLGRSERAVYDHSRGRWIAPRRWIRYDGAPEDLVLAAAAAAPAIATYDEPVRGFLLAVLGVSAGYVLVRKRLAGVWERLVAALPAAVAVYLPERFLDATTEF